MHARKTLLIGSAVLTLMVGLAACSQEDAKTEDTAATGTDTTETDTTGTQDTATTVAEVPMAEDEAVTAEEAATDDPARPSQTYDARAFFETTSVSISSSDGYPFSPDGSAVLVSWDKTGIFNAYALPLDGGEPVALTQSTESTFAASFFPGDGRMLFVADKGGNELDHLYVREEDGTVTDLTPAEEAKADFGGFIDGGARFLAVSNERDARFFDLYAYDAADYSRELIFQNDEGFQLGAVTDDARYLALVKPRTSADSDVYLVDLAAETPEPVLITEHEGNVSHGVYEFTPDGSKLVYATNEYGEFNQAWTHDIETGEKAAYVTADWDLSFLFFSPSGRYRITGVNEDARTKVSITDLTTGEPLALPDLPKGNLANVRFTPDEGRVAFLLTSDTAPANVYLADLEAGSVVQLTDTKNPAIDEADLVPAEVVRYESFDGLEIPSILYKPLQASAETPVPALVWVHGGPGGQSRAGYSATIQHLVNHGYAVLAANNRGSSGYGKTFFHMDDKRHGEVDLQDIVWGQKYLAGLDWVDGGKIGIIGGSYGGYMVVAALAFEPDVFEVGIDIFGVTNWVRTLTSIPPWWESFKEALYDEMGDPATDGERHQRISPLFHAENIVKPLLVVQGANDPRVLQVESDEMVEAVRANGVPVEYIIFPDEGHGFLKRENRITASDAYVRFLDEYLKGAE